MLLAVPFVIGFVFKTFRTVGSSLDAVKGDDDGGGRGRSKGRKDKGRSKDKEREKRSSRGKKKSNRGEEDDAGGHRDLAATIAILSGLQVLARLSRLWGGCKCTVPPTRAPLERHCSIRQRLSGWCSHSQLGTFPLQALQWECTEAAS